MIAWYERHDMPQAARLLRQSQSGLERRIEPTICASCGLGPASHNWLGECQLQPAVYIIRDGDHQSEILAISARAAVDHYGSKSGVAPRTTVRVNGPDFHGLEFQTPDWQHALVDDVLCELTIDMFDCGRELSGGDVQRLVNSALLDAAKTAPDRREFGFLVTVKSTWSKQEFGVNAVDARRAAELVYSTKLHRSFFPSEFLPSGFSSADGARHEVWFNCADGGRASMIAERA